MFDGEYASLIAIKNTGCVRVPNPIAVLDDPDIPSGAMLVMENVNIRALSSSSKELGEYLGRYVQKLRRRSLYTKSIISS